MANLKTSFAGIKSPNPFWLASAPQPIRRIMSAALLRPGGAGLYGKHWGKILRW